MDIEETNKPKFLRTVSGRLDLQDPAVTDNLMHIA
jgi:hypothetical protein